MKIAIDCRMYNSSGIGTYLQGILPYLLDEQKNDYLLLGNFNILSKYKAKNVEIQEVNINTYLCFYPRCCFLRHQRTYFKNRLLYKEILFK